MSDRIGERYLSPISHYIITTIVIKIHRCSSVYKVDENL